MYLLFISTSAFCIITYLCLPPSTDILVRLSSLISLDTVACVTLKPALLRASASSSCVPMLYFFINSTILLCLSDFIASPLINNFYSVICYNYTTIRVITLFLINPLYTASQKTHNHHSYHSLNYCFMTFAKNYERPAYIFVLILCKKLNLLVFISLVFLSDLLITILSPDII